MKIGLIGLGDIAKKAYLPVLAEKEGVELVLCTRDPDTLHKLAKKYRITTYVQTVEELIDENIDAAFVSVAAKAHVEIADKLLDHGIHTYIDKPISFHLHDTKQIVDKANAHGAIAMVGFNRRFAPMIRDLKEKGKPNLILIQKNRFSLPGVPRQFVVEDFIHVVDTLRFLMNTEVKDIKFDFLYKDGHLQHLILHLIGEETTAIGIMNRNSGVTEEIIEYTTDQHKYVIDSLVTSTHYHNRDKNIQTFGDWEPTLSKRGFYQMVDHFIDCVQHNKTPQPSLSDSLITHQICEQIVSQIEASISK
ncbi:Putative oxidoreductase YceM [Paraliobacillus sp. PM-2]|uniref:Gfo/Idh/MocA family protein n=1 Tax=Paraliobacillus sp. PM-2 TaxID=1462524 RepID=UPI00061B9321|nr:Gfo/Idh/MocA family oxidoreductase [Paraliobacillus sp. PM-2]CQR45974.1 Putative oxidoreductase YceM [Paraliobacillus sp. PM-2]